MTDDFDYQLEFQRLSCTLEELAKHDEDTVMMCLLRLLAEYHDLKAEKMWEALERERQKTV